MELIYKNERLQNICENSKYNRELVKRYGIEVAKKLPKYEFDETDVDDDLVLTKAKSRGLLLATMAGAIYLLFFIYNIIPGLPLSGALLDKSQTFYIDKLFSYN